MKVINKPSAALLALMLAAGAAGAAKPVSVALSSSGSDAAGAEFSVYQVKCSNDTMVPITNWPEGNQWCVGDESREMCFSRKMKAAQEACQID